MKFVYNTFGILAPYEEDAKYLWAVNDQGDKRKISKDKYPNYPEIKRKLEMLVGKPCILRTSQTTAPWPKKIWFSDVYLDDGRHDTRPKEGDDKKIEAIADLEAQLAKEKQEHNVTKQKHSEASEQIQELVKEKDEVLDELNKKDKKISEHEFDLREQDKAREDEDYKQRKQDEKALDDMKLRDTTQSVTVRGHTRRTLALRWRVVMSDKQKRLQMKIIKKVKENKYKCEVKQENKTKRGDVALGVDGGIFAYTFLPLHEDWESCFKQVKGESEKAIKDRTDISFADLVKIHNEVMEAGVPRQGK